MTALIGQRVTYRTSSTRTVPALITHIVSADQVNLVGLIDINSDWPSGEGMPGHPANFFGSVNRGTGVGEWQECDVEPGTTAAISTVTAGLATENYADDAATAAATAAVSGLASTSYVDSETGACCAVPTASAPVSLASGTPRQPSATRPVLVMVTGSWSWSLSAVGTQSGSLTLQSDSSSSPTTAIYAPAWSRGISVGVTIGDTGTEPVCMSYLVPPGHYYQVVATGGATFTIREQAL